MAVRKKKSEIVRLAECLANLDVIDVSSLTGEGYLIWQLRQIAAAVVAHADALESAPVSK